MSQFRFSIDRGGTFTDVYAEWKDASGKCSVGIVGAPYTAGILRQTVKLEVCRQA